MKPTLFSTALGISLSVLACGGNVNVGGTGGSGGTVGSSASTSSASTSSSTGADDFYSCNGPGQCTLAGTGCCSKCGPPALADFAAVSVSKLADYQKYVCPEPQPCPGCATVFDPNLIAYCSAGKCVAADIRTDALSACKADSDCHLRNGAACCESCVEDSSQVVAVSYTASPQLAELMCAPGGGCPKCLPQYPPDLAPACGGNGHCTYVSGASSGP
jgi:hypothetical protein